MDGESLKNFSPKKGTATLNADAAQGLHDTRQRLVKLLARRAQGETGAGDGAPASEDFIHWERRLAGRMGLSLDVVRGLRSRLVEGVDWRKQGRGRIVYSEKGAARLRELGRVPTAPAAEKAAPGEQQEDGGVALRVVRRCPNAHIVLCHEPDKDPGDVGNLVRLWVRDNKNWRGGMEVRGRHLEGDVYELAPNGGPGRGVR